MSIGFGYCDEKKVGRCRGQKKNPHCYGSRGDEESFGKIEKKWKPKYIGMQIAWKIKEVGCLFGRGWRKIGKMMSILNSK